MAINTFLIWLLHLPWEKVRTLVSPLFSKGLSSNSSSVVNWQTVLCLKCSSVNIQYHLWIAGIFIVKSMRQKKSDCRWHWSLLPFALWKDTIITTKLQEAWGEQGHLVLCHLFKLPISVTMEESSYLPFNFIVFGGYYAISLSLKFLFFVRSCLDKFARNMATLARPMLPPMLPPKSWYQITSHLLNEDLTELDTKSSSIWNL